MVTGTSCELYAIGDGECDPECVTFACPHFILREPTTDLCASGSRITDYDGGDCSGCTVASWR